MLSNNQKFYGAKFEISSFYIKKIFDVNNFVSGTFSAIYEKVETKNNPLVNFAFYFELRIEFQKINPA